MLTDHTDHKPLMKALRRSHGSSSSSPSNPSTLSSSSSSISWVHLRSVLLVVAPSSSSSSSSNASSNHDRASVKSPWSRRRRKHALLPKQWKRLFTPEGKLIDGGITLLKKVRSGGVDPSLRAEVWPFLLGLYDVNSSKEERDAVRAQKRKEFENLQKQCQRIIRRVNDKNPTVKVPSCQDSPETETCSTRMSFSVEVESPLTDGSDLPIFDQSPNCSGLLEGPTSEVASGNDTESSDTDSSEEPEHVLAFLSEETDDEKGTEVVEANEDPSGTEPKAHTDEDFASWQRIMCLDALRADDEWIAYSPSQASPQLTTAQSLADTVGLKDFDHLSPCKILHAARLVTILQAYAVYDPEIGYCQGMTDLLSPIISIVEDDDIAFWCFVGFMKKARHNFRLDEVGIRRQLNIVSKIIKCKDIGLYRHLENLQAEDCFFVYRMVVVLFRRELSFEETICLWEVVWADQAAIKAGIAKSAWRRMRVRAPPCDDLLLYAIAACVLQRRKLIIEKYSSVDDIVRECNGLAGHLDVWKLLDDAHDLVVNLHDKI